MSATERHVNDLGRGGHRRLVDAQNLAVLSHGSVQDRFVNHLYLVPKANAAARQYGNYGLHDRREVKEWLQLLLLLFLSQSNLEVWIRLNKLLAVGQCGIGSVPSAVLLAFGNVAVLPFPCDDRCVDVALVIAHGPTVTQALGVAATIAGEIAQWVAPVQVQVRPGQAVLTSL